MPAKTDATYAEAAASGPPVPPLPFPEPVYTPARRVMKLVHVPEANENDGEDDAAAADPSNASSTEEGANTPRPLESLKRAESMSGNVLVPLGGGDTNNNPDDATSAYWIQRKIATISCGSVRIGYVLRRKDGEGEGNDGLSDGEKDHKGAKHTADETAPESSSAAAVAAAAQWEVTPKPSPDGMDAYEMCAIKMYDRTRLNKAADGKRSDNPSIDISASQLLAKHSPDYHHVLGTTEVLADERFVYVVVPYCGDGTLLDYVESRGVGRLEESTARHFFKQMLSALGLFQTVGLCHRDLSLEHILLRGGDCFTTGKNKCLRIPYNCVGNSDSPSGDVTDVESGSIRRLIAPQGQRGKPQYVGPVILANREGFDGHAADLWSAGVILFHMLFGFPPFVWAGSDDPRFLAICVKGRLDEFANNWMKEDSSSSQKLSDHAIDLLQSMLRAKPEDRLSLSEVLKHPWVVSDDVKRPESLSSATTAVRRAASGK